MFVGKRYTFCCVTLVTDSIRCFVDNVNVWLSLVNMMKKYGENGV